MARHKDRRKISKDHLAIAVRKDFNAGMVQEQEVVTSFLYSIHNQGAYLCYILNLEFLMLIFLSDKSFRMRFAPSKSK